MQDLQAAVVRLKAKAVQQKFEDTFVNGDTAVDAKSFDGIDKLTTGGQALTMGVNGATLTLAKLDELVDQVKGGPPALLLMSKRSRRTLNTLARTTGSLLQADRNEFGQMVQFYDGIPVGVSDYISDTKTVGSSSDCSTIYALQLGEGAVAGLTSPGGLQVETVGSLETKDATRTRVKWYVALGALQHHQGGKAHRRPPVARRTPARAFSPPRPVEGRPTGAPSHCRSDVVRFAPHGTADPVRARPQTASASPTPSTGEGPPVVLFHAASGLACGARMAHPMQ